MGYAVKKNPNGLASKFKLYHRTTTKDGKRGDYYIPPQEYKLHGFSSNLTFDEARSRASQLNSQNELKRHAERKTVIAKQLRDEAREYAAYVPDEEEFLAYAAQEMRYATVAGGKFRSHWHCTKAMIATLKLTPPEFFDNRRVIYRYCAKNQYAVSYCQKLLRCLNLYGRFHTRKYKAYFEEVPYPTGYDRGDLEDAHHAKARRKMPAKALTPELLEKCRTLPPPQYNWMYLSMWCGLRPVEIDALHNPDSYRWEIKEGVHILWVFQSKLGNLPRDKRWKPIPLVEPEQDCVRDIIESKEFERPLVKSIVARIGDGYKCQSGRKGFETLMGSRGHAFDYVSQWLGHQSLDRTWKNYTERDKARFKKRA